MTSSKTIFKKERLHQGGSIPFWDWNWSGWLVIEKGGRKVSINAFEVLELKQLLNKEFDGRTGKWKS